MRRALAIITSVVILSAAALQVYPIDRLEAAIGKMTMDSGATCTAFAIHPTAHRWVTASHCLVKADGTPETGLAVRGNPVTLVVEQEPTTHGIAVIVVKDEGRPTKVLRLGPEPKKGARVLQMGFGGGSPQILFFEGLFISPAMSLGEEEYQFNSALTMPGMSGGPIVDVQGRVVGVVSGAFQPTPMPTLVSFTEPWAKIAATMKKWGQ